VGEKCSDKFRLRIRLPRNSLRNALPLPLKVKLELFSKTDCYMSLLRSGDVMEVTIEMTVFRGAIQYSFYNILFHTEMVT